MTMPGGRPPILTPELRESICDALRAGNYLETAAVLNGVCKATLFLWLKRGTSENKRLAKNQRFRIKKAEAQYVEFLDAVKKAQAVAEARDVAVISLAGKTQWQASAWRLERKHFERWGRKQVFEHSGPGGKPIEAKAEVKAAGLTEATIESIKRHVLGIDGESPEK